jgi:hypothetical protein
MRKFTVLAVILLTILSITGCSVSSPYPETMYTQDIDVAGDITITGTVDGVDVSTLRSPIIVRKTAGQTIFNSDVLQDDTDLKLNVGANEIWAFDMVFRSFAPSPALGFFNYCFSIPVGSSISIVDGNTGTYTGETEYDGTIDTGANSFYVNSPDFISQYRIHCLYIGGVNAGIVQLRWAQYPSCTEPFTYTMCENSYIIAYKLN